MILLCSNFQNKNLSMISCGFWQILQTIVVLTRLAACSFKSNRQIKIIWISKYKKMLQNRNYFQNSKICFVAIRSYLSVYIIIIIFSCHEIKLSTNPSSSFCSHQNYVGLLTVPFHQSSSHHNLIKTNSWIQYIKHVWIKSN